ncbi:MAG: lipase family protein [Pseudomonadota bacterium]
MQVVSVTDYSSSSLDLLKAQMEDAGAGITALSTALGGYGTMDGDVSKAYEKDEDTQSILDIILVLAQEFVHMIKYPLVSPSQVVFRWVDGGENQSGLLVTPDSSYNESYPMIVFMHPTQTLRKFSPSYNDGSDDEMTAQYAHLLAMMGYIVVVPDYLGLGVNHEVHPYCLTTLAKSATGMIYAVKQLNTDWDGRIFIMGYSEGGYATLVTAKEIEQNNPDLDLVAAAALDGPHSLSEIMHGVMLDADENYKAPYFLPYVIAGYGAAYPDLPEVQFENAVIDDPAGFRDQLFTLMNGDYSASQLNDLIRQVQPYEGPASILTNDTIDALRDPDSLLNEKLLENDSYYDWLPSIHVLLCHNVYDDLVPVENSTLAEISWKDIPNVQVDFFSDYMTGQGTIHAGAAPYAYIRGTNWLNDLAGK